MKYCPSDKGHSRAFKDRYPQVLEEESRTGENLIHMHVCVHSRISLCDEVVSELCEWLKAV